MASTDTVLVPTPVCFMCGNAGEVALTEDQLRRFKSEGLIQNLLPEVDADTREQLMTGTHPACWDEMTGFFGDND